MALMFSRVARNFAKKGYFPTDVLTMDAIRSRLKLLIESPDHSNPIRVLDPCCGEGGALSDLQSYFSAQCSAVVEAIGIELDDERAWHAKSLQQFSQVAHADVNDVVVAPRSVSCLFLNPPYGDLLSDRAQTGEVSTLKQGRDRLEKMFFDRTIVSLQYDGLLILIVPFYTIDEDFAVRLACNFKDVNWMMSPEQTYKQAIVFGRRVKTRHPPKQLVADLVEFGNGLAPAGSSAVSTVKYAVPANEIPFWMRVVRIDAKQLGNELAKIEGKTLWSQFATQFRCAQAAHRQWLCEPSEWHLALALAAGQVYGSVVSVDGRILLIKGDTIKGKNTTVEQTVDEQGNVSEKLIKTDIFIPIITGLDFTPNLSSFGAVVAIQ